MFIRTTRSNPSAGVALSLTVAPGPTITTQPTSQAITAGAGVTFTVASSDPGPLTYRWRKNGVDLNDGGNISGAGTATLTISSATSAGRGGLQRARFK
jgi:hypothetical protein